VSAGTVEEIVYARQIYKQQQANIGYNASTERRYFKGVQNSKFQKGELFGLENLLTFHGDDIVLRGIVNKTNVAEARQGLNVLEVEVDMDAILQDDDNPLRVDNDESGDAAMSQLAALITEGERGKGKTKPRRNAQLDPIHAILASAGVEYTHENSEVVGSSKIEAELSRRAEEAGNDISYGETRLFAESQSQRVSQAEAPAGDDEIRYQFHPPEDLMVRQFCTMAKTFGFESATEFAFVVEGWTRTQRTNVLERFYRKRRQKLFGMNNGKSNDLEEGGQSVYETSMSTLAHEDESHDDLEPTLPSIVNPTEYESKVGEAKEEDLETEDDYDDEL
jgi:hypothetical protein